MRAWRSQAAHSSEPPSLAWLLTITRNEARRLHGRSREHLDVDDVVVEDGRAPDALDHVAMRIDVRRVLGHLPRADRRLVMLRYDLELTNPELASLLGLPEGTIKVRLHRARTRMRGWLEESYE